MPSATPPDEAEAELDRALRGERNVYCLVCCREFAAVLSHTQPQGPLRHIHPKEHNSPPPISRAVCTGSFLQATLTPRLELRP